MKTLRLIAQPILIALVMAIGVRSAVHIYSIPTASMDPTLQAGDHIVVTPYRSDLPQHGDVVVFRSPVNGNELLVKRIVATPGDLVESRAGRLFVRGHAVAEPYLRAQAATGSVAPQVVPAACYFVLGDNRGNSFDSRQWGLLPRASIVGRARMVLWSSHSDAIGPRVNASPLASSRIPASTLRFERLFKPIR